MNFLKLENQYTQNFIQAADALHNHINSLNTKLNDWSNWDDTYTFIEDKNNEYITSNLGDSVFTQIKGRYH